jgi:ribosome biogenesis GTP-binding protein YsxC/EngB
MLARTSQTPGRTRQLIFFNLANRLQLVDLPGYGYASAPKTDIKAWTNLTRKYLAGRPSLQRVFLLIDSRRGVGPADHDIMALLDETAVSWALVITKAEKYARRPKQKSVNMLPPIPNYSSPHLKMEQALRHCGRICQDLPCQRPIGPPPKAGNAI